MEPVTLTKQSPEEYLCDDYELLLLADPQLAEAPIWPNIFLSSLFGDSFGPPAARSPGQILAAPTIQEFLAITHFDRYQSLHKNPLCYRVALSGDDIDLGSARELKIAKASEDRMTDHHDALKPAFRTPGNHGIGPSGISLKTLSSRFLKWILEIEQEDESFVKNHYNPIVGGSNFAMTKKELLAFYHRMDKLDFRPTIVRIFNKDGFKKDGGLYQQWPKRALKTPQYVEKIYKDFFVETPNLNKQLYQARAVVEYNPKFKKDIEPNQKWLYLTVTQLSNFEQGNVYMVSVDSTDSMGDRDGNLPDLHNGRVSEMQVHLLEAAMQHVRAIDKQAKFMMHKHHPIKDVRDLKSSGYVKLLKHPDVIAEVVAHSHHASIVDINQTLDLDLGHELWQITSPAIIDHRNGALSVNISKNKDTTEVRFHFDELDQKSIGDALVKAEFNKIKDSLLPHVRVQKRVAAYHEVFGRLLEPPPLPHKSDDSRPGSVIMDYLRRLDLILDRRYGLIASPERINTEITANVIIPQLAEESHTYLKIANSVITLCLKDAQLDEAANLILPLINTINTQLESLDHFYEQHRADGRGEKPPVLDALNENINRLQKLVWTLETQTDKTKPQAKAALSLVKHYGGYTNHFSQWLYATGQLKRLNLSPDNLKGHINLFDQEDFRQMIASIQTGLPIKSRARDLLVLVGHEAAAQWYAWKRQGERDKSVPGDLTLHVDANGVKKFDRTEDRIETDQKLTPTPKTPPHFENKPWWEPTAVVALPVLGEGIKAALGIDTWLLWPDSSEPYWPNLGLSTAFNYRLNLDGTDSLGADALFRVAEPTGHWDYGIGVMLNTDLTGRNKWTFQKSLKQEIRFDYFGFTISEDYLGLGFDLAKYFNSRGI